MCTVFGCSIPTRKEHDFVLRVTVIDDGEGPVNPPLKPLDRFTRFPDLPTEIRLKVWEHAIFPRLVMAAVVEGGDDRSDANVTGGAGEQEEQTAATSMSWRTQLRRRTKVADGRKQRQVPAVLHICRESRGVGLRAYGVGFSWVGARRCYHPVCRAAQNVAVEAETTEMGLSSDAAPPDVVREAVKEHVRLFPAGTDPWSFHPPRTFFTKHRDAPVQDILFLAGDLEPCDEESGLTRPAAYYFSRASAGAVSRLAIPFSSLRIDQIEAEDVATVLFHVLDKFFRLVPDVLTVLVEEGDEEVLGPAEMGRVRGARHVAASAGGNGEGGCTREGGGGGLNDNVVSKIWTACLGRQRIGRVGTKGSVKTADIELMRIGDVMTY